MYILCFVPCGFAANIECKMPLVLFLIGPEFWGLVNPEWSLCSKGKRQSPIDIDPKQLLYDEHLNPVRFDKHRVSNI